MAKNFDTTISVYGLHVRPTRKDLFTSTSGFVWDKDYWVSPDRQNDNLFIPSLWDPSTSNIPRDFFRSGYAHGDGLKIQNIKRFKVEGNEQWHTEIMHGSYFVRNVPYYLYSSESVLLQLGKETTEDGRSLQKLKFLPKQGIPISASILGTDINSRNTIDVKRFKKVGEFTGMIQNGIELDSAIPANIDRRKNEFIVRYNSNNTRSKWRIPANLTLSERASISFDNIKFSTIDLTSNYNGYSIEFISSVLAGQEKIEVSNSNIIVHIEAGVSTTEDVVETFNSVFASEEDAEELRIICLPGVGLGGKYFLLDSPQESYYVWFNTGSDVDPLISGRTSIEVAVQESMNATEVAIELQIELEETLQFKTAANNEVIFCTNLIKGIVNDPQDETSGFTLEVIRQGSDNLILAEDLDPGSGTLEEAVAARALSSVYSFYLPEVPLSDYHVNFSRKDIFKKQKFVSEPYGEGIYGTFLYGQGVSELNDYAIDYETGEVLVILDQDYIDLGHIDYTFDYPAIIEFNDNYLGSTGEGIEIPTATDLPDLALIAESSGQPNQLYVLGEFPILDYSTNEYLDEENFKLFIYNAVTDSFELDWSRTVSLDLANSDDKVYEFNPSKGEIKFGDDTNGSIPSKYLKIYAKYNRSVSIQYEPVSSSDIWIGKNIDLNLSKNDLSSGFLFLSRKDLIPFKIKLQFSTNKITALDYADLTATVLDIDNEPIHGLKVNFELLNALSYNLESTSAITNFEGKATVSYLPSGNIEDLGTFVHLFAESEDEGDPGDPLSGVYFSSSSVLANNMILLDSPIEDELENVYIFKVYDNIDELQPYNNISRSGGLHQVLFKYDFALGKNILVRPTAISGNVLIFEDSLPQPFSASDPNYESNLRGFIVVSKKLVQAKASLSFDRDELESDIANLQIEYSTIQKGEWTLPILPTSFIGSEISRASYIMINPPKNEMVFTQGGDTDTIALEHDDVLGYTIKVWINDLEFDGWSFNSSVSPNEIKWDHNAVKDQDKVVISYAYGTP